MHPIFLSRTLRIKKQEFSPSNARVRETRKTPHNSKFILFDFQDQMLLETVLWREHSRTFNYIKHITSLIETTPFSLLSSGSDRHRLEVIFTQPLCLHMIQKISTNHKGTFICFTSGCNSLILEVARNINMASCDVENTIKSVLSKFHIKELKK